MAAAVRKDIEGTWNSFRLATSAAPCRPDVFPGESFDPTRLHRPGDGGHTARHFTPGTWEFAKRFRLCPADRPRLPASRAIRRPGAPSGAWRPVGIHFCNDVHQHRTVIVDLSDIPQNLYPAAATQLPTTVSDVPEARVHVLTELVRDLSSGRPSIAGAQRILAALLWLSAANAVLSRYRGRRKTCPGRTRAGKPAIWDGRLGNFYPTVRRLSGIHDEINGWKITDHDISQVTGCVQRHLDSAVPDCQVRVDTAQTADVTTSEFVPV